MKYYEIKLEGMVKSISGKGKMRKIILESKDVSCQCTIFKGNVSENQFYMVSHDLQEGTNVEMVGQLIVTTDSPNGWEVDVSNIIRKAG